jgi:hypothetical protein
MPTDDDLRKVKTNLTNMQAFNDYLYTDGNSYILNCYALLSETQKDEGKTVCIEMMTSAFNAMSEATFGDVGSIGATVFCGILETWDSAPPADMSEAFDSLVTRFQHASQDLDTQLAAYHADPTGNWDVQFSYGGRTCTLGDLATVSFPAESDPEFFTLMNPCERSLDQYIWRYVLLNGGFQLNEWLPETCMPADFDFNAWGNGFYPVHPSYWGTCYYHQDTGDCGDSTYWGLTQWNLATGSGTFSDGAISDDAANYLFSDLSPGTPNPKTSWKGQGLYTRDEVFTEWGIKVHQIYSTHASAPEDGKGWFRYMRTKRMELPVLSDLQSSIGMGGIKERILAAVKADPSLRAGLKTHPRETMEQILGVTVPDFMVFDFVLEGPRRYGLVIPWEE